ncbi:MAG: adenosine kinase [Bacteroidales bacterium]|nr:adenosine kinase [Bacteroidales bacterium]
MKILGMGNALTDLLIKTNDDSLLQSHNLPKGSMQLVDFDRANAVVQSAKDLPTGKASGGSAANTIHGLAKLGLETAFFGKVGQDETGHFFHTDLINNGIESKLMFSESKSGVAVALVTPDAERTFATYLGAAVELSPDDLTPELFINYDIFYIEGYLVQNHQLIKRAVDLASQAGCKVCLDLAAYNVVEANLDFLKSILNKVDILFANEEEARAFTGKEPEQALEELAKTVDLTIVKTGKNGSLVKTGGKIYSAGIIQANSIDTTGAGDLYAAGFLFGLTKGYSPDQCARIGSIVAGNVIEVVGAKMDENRWQRIHEMINQI